MLIRQATINLSANVLSALLGLFSVFVFTRLFSAHDYGIYLLGVGFASVISVAFIGWFRNLILSEHAKNDGTDIRGLVISGYLVACLSAPLAYGLGRLVGLDAWAAAAAVGLAVAVGLFELDPGSGARPAHGHDRHEGHAGSRAVGALPGRGLYADRPHRIPVCWPHRRWPICSQHWSRHARGAGPSLNSMAPPCWPLQSWGCR